MIKIILPDGVQRELAPALIWVMVSLFIAIKLTFYLLRSFGLYTMAKKRELKHAFLAFIPCAWMYTACKLIGKVRMFGSTFEKLALTFVIIFSVGETLSFFYDFIVYFPIIGNFLSGKELYWVWVTDPELAAGFTAGMKNVGNGLYCVDFSNPYTNMGIEPQTVNVVMSVIYYISMFTDIAILFISISVYINLFRRYAPRHYILFSILSFMGIFAPFVFAVRKKEPVNYSDYLRSRYSMWYANGNPYGGQAPNGEPQAPSTPFEEFAEKDEIDPGDPFDNFDYGKPKENNDNNEDKDDFFD